MQDKDYLTGNLTFMRLIHKDKARKQLADPIKAIVPATDDILRHLAFDNSLQANIITAVNLGKIIMANRAACKLLGYSKRELLTKTRSDIFAIKEASFKKMLGQRTVEGQSRARVTAIKKTAGCFPVKLPRRFLWTRMV